MKLPSGAELKANLAPFSDAKALLQALAEEGIELEIRGDQEVDYNFFKNIIFKALSSKKIEDCVLKCASRSVIEGVKITPDLFEAEDKRGDYYPMCLKVAEVNLLPFTKSLYAKLSPILEKLKSSPA